VVAVVITHDPGPWFEETLESLRAQSYDDLGYLFVDTASVEDPTDRINAVLPDAHVHRLDHDPGFSVAANLVTELVDGASFYLFCHDDIAVEPDAVRALVQEAFRSNAGIIGPKLVDWNDPRRLLQVGMGADKTGVLSPNAEPGELDQEQHDGVRDVFVVPGACTLIRADLFGALGGFDEAIDYLGEDLDLCWRAHTLGARVLVAPVARVRHLEALGLRRPRDDRRKRLARHRLRTSLVAYGWAHRLRVIPQALLFALIEALYGVLSGHPEQSRDVLSAWSWNARRGKQVRERRKKVAASRTVADREVRELQVRGNARLNALIRGQIGHREDRVATFARSSRDVVGAMQSGSRQLTGAFALALGLLLVISSRNLITGDIPAIGEMSRFPHSPGDLFATWWSGWRRAGLGGAGAQPTGLPLLGSVGYLFLGAMGLVRKLIILGTIPVGAVGAWRLARPISSSRASVAAFAVYLAIPVPYNALARGSLSGLLAYAASPWVLLLLGKAAGIAPFGPDRVDEDDPAIAAPRRKLVGLILGLGLLLGVVGAFSTVILVVALAVGLALVLGSLLCFRFTGVLRLLAATFGSVAVAIALNMPWSLELIGARSPWNALAGVGAASGGPLTLGRIMRFESGPWGAPPLGWAFLLAAALPLIIGRSWRLEWAVRAWVVVVAGWAVLWAGQDGRLPFGLPSSEVVLAPVAAALALTAALGLASFEIDLRAYRFGWRQVLSVAAALGVLLGAIPLAAGLLDGQWRMPSRDYSASLDALLEPVGQPPFRVLWIGDQEVLPVTGWRLDDDVVYATTDRGAPSVVDNFAGPPPGATPQLAEVLEVAQARGTNRPGHLLAPMGIRYLILPSRLAPRASGNVSALRPVPRALVDTLAQQLDLEEVPVGDGLLVYRNIAAAPLRSVLPAATGERTSTDDAAREDISDAKPALSVNSGPVDAVGRVPAPGDVLVAQSADDDWSLKIAGVPMGRRVARLGFGVHRHPRRLGLALVSHAVAPPSGLAGTGVVLGGRHRRAAADPQLRAAGQRHLRHRI